jgi:CheY-like chemotaxis protein
VSLVICSLTERARRAETKERAVEGQLLITLKSIGDAVIATDERGRVAFMNEVAEELTGWTTQEARGKDLREVFKIINELTRAEADNPVVTVIREGMILEGLRILVVDDERDAREMIQAVLEKHGARVFAAATTREALNTFEQHELDVLLSDIGMPDEDGYTLIRRIRARPKEAGGQIPAAAVSAYVGEENRQLALDAGFHLHIAKPLDPIDLIAIVHKLAENSRR